MPKKKIKPIRKKVLKKFEEKELIIKTKPEWVKSALANKAKYQKKYSDSIKKNDNFWKGLLYTSDASDELKPSTLTTHVTYQND